MDDAASSPGRPRDCRRRDRRAPCRSDSDSGDVDSSDIDSDSDDSGEAEETFDCADATFFGNQLDFDTAGTLRGQVVSPSGDIPVAGAEVTVDIDGQGAWTLSAEAGCFNLELPPGSHTVTVIKGRYQSSHEVELVADEVADVGGLALGQGEVKMAVVHGKYDDVGLLIAGNAALAGTALVAAGPMEADWRGVALVNGYGLAGAAGGALVGVIASPDADAAGVGGMVGSTLRLTFGAISAMRPGSTKDRTVALAPGPLPVLGVQAQLGMQPWTADDGSQGVEVKLDGRG